MKFSLALVGLFAAIAMADDCQVGSRIHEKEFRKKSLSPVETCYFWDPPLTEILSVAWSVNICAAQVYRTAAEKFAVELSSRQVEQLKSLENQVLYLVLYLYLYLSLICNLHSRDPNPCLPPTVCARMARAGLVAERSLVSRTFRNLRTFKDLKDLQRRIPQK